MLAGPASAQEVIERFASEVSVARDGTLTVAETIRVRAEGDQIKRGIYRDFPLTFEDAGGAVHEVGFKLLSVTRDGAPEPHFTQSQGESIRIYAGKEDVYLQRGQSYTYVFTYETDRQIRWHDSAPELYWNVTGNAWNFPIQAASVSVTLPDHASPNRWTAYTGGYGERGTDFEGAVTDGTLTVRTTRTLAPGEGLTIVAAIPAGAVTPPSAADETRWFLRDNRGWIIGIFGFVLVLGYYGVTWNAVGRDPKGGTIIPLFHPPEGVSPALAAYIHNWGFGMNAWRELTAAALALAVRGLLVFDQQTKGELTLERTKKKWPGGHAALPAGERAILQWVDSSGGRAHIAQSNAASVQGAVSRFTKAILAESRNKFFRRNTAYFVGGLALTAVAILAVLVFGGLQGNELGALIPVVFVGIVFGVFILPTVAGLFRASSGGATIRAGLTLIAVLGFFGAFAAQFLAMIPGDARDLASAAFRGLAHHPLPVAIVLVFPALNGLFFYLLKAPTPLGRPIMDRIAGLRMYLETAESGRLNIADAPEITTEHFEALLPYAVALDVEKPWANAFATALRRAHPDDPDPIAGYHPAWSRGSRWSSDNFGRSIASTVSSATSALAASQPRSSSSSSGFSSSGGSGGGGGGGGGGGW